MSKRNVTYGKGTVTRLVASVDWLTCTAATPDARRELWTIGDRILHRSKVEGEQPTAWHAHGYRGWTCRGMAVGERADTCILRLSGYEASQEWQHAIRAAENASRLDTAVDVYFEHPMTALAVNLYRDSGHVSSRNGRPITRTLIRDSNHGQTCYLGKRISDEMGRLYDKGVQSREDAPGMRWRYEVEYKRERALQRAQWLLQADSETIALAWSTREWFLARGGRVWPQSESCAVRNWEPRDSTVDQQLHWLSRGVRPTAVALCDSLGYDRVLTALGLLQARELLRQSAVTPAQE